MKFGLLGALTAATDSGQHLSIARGVQTGMLTLLLLNGNQVVARDHVIAELWPAPPSSARAILHNNVSALRQALGSQAGRLATRPGGYELAVEPGELDLTLFEQHIFAGRQAMRQSDWAAAHREFGAALDLWRGQPFTDPSLHSIAITEGHRLSKMKLATTQAQAEASINMGQFDEAIAILTKLTQAEPLREKAHVLLMIALACAGERNAALEAYQRAWRLLDDQGLETSQELNEVQRRILCNQPLLPALDPA